MAATDTAEPLSREEAIRLTDFARACKAAARVVALYPPTHPAIHTSLDRVADAGRRLRAGNIVTLTVLPDTLWLDGRAVERPDAALGEMADLLHSHLIGEMSLTDDLTVDAWHSFLTLLARDTEEIRSQGGIARAWLDEGGGPIELRQIDYAEVLRERKRGAEGDWDRIIATYLQADWSNFDDEALATLFEIAKDQDKFKEFIARFVERASESGLPGKTDVVLRVLQALVAFVARQYPDRLDHMLTQIAGVVSRLTPDQVMTLITTGVPLPDGGTPGAIDLPEEVRGRLSDKTVAEFVAQSIARDHGATERLAQAFQALVPDTDKRAELLEIAAQEAQNLPMAQESDFADLWKNAADLLRSYSDADYVSSDYARELASVRTHAVEIESIHDDPPDRVSDWLATVSQTEIKRLDQQILLELLDLEARPDRWKNVMESALEAIGDHVRTGDIELAQAILDKVVAATERDAAFAEAARAGLEQLVNGPLMADVIAFTRHAHASDTEQIAMFCRALGPRAIGPLAEALAVEQGSAVKRLRDIVLSFGAAGRTYADSLRRSANSSVRLTAVELLRAFGGAGALSDLMALVDDPEPAVQREALRSIVQIGTNEAFTMLLNTLESSDTGQRDLLVRVLGASTDERATPLFVHILTHGEHRGRHEAVYRLAIEALGRIGRDGESVSALKTALYRGEWWAPRRTARLRAAAASALRTSGSAEAMKVLEQAARDASGGVKRAAVTALRAPAPRAHPRRSS